MFSDKKLRTRLSAAKEIQTIRVAVNDYGALGPCGDIDRHRLEPPISSQCPQLAQAELALALRII